MKKLINGIAATLIAASLCTAGAAIVNQARLEERVKSDHELIKETNETVKEIRGMFIRHLEK